MWVAITTIQSVKHHVFLTVCSMYVMMFTRLQNIFLVILTFFLNFSYLNSSLAIAFFFTWQSKVFTHDQQKLFKCNVVLSTFSTTLWISFRAWVILYYHYKYVWKTLDTVANFTYAQGRDKILKSPDSVLYDARGHFFWATKPILDKSNWFEN